MRTLLQFVRRFWNWLCGRSLRFRTERVLDIPESFEADSIYLVGEREYLWAVAFICPCGCRETVQLSLLKDARPRWQIVEHYDGTVSLSPSVWRTKGCKSHFFVRHGQIDWVPNRATA